MFPAHVLGVASLGDHVQIYSGRDTVIEAPNPTTVVREIALSHWWPGEAVFAKRLIAAPAQNTAGNYYGAGKHPTGAAPKMPGNTAGNYYGA
jgi:hypothetical protein